MSPLQAYIARLAQEYKTGVTTEPVTSVSKLALLMAGKAQLLARSIAAILTDEKSEAAQDFLQQIARMKEVLRSDVSPTEFADWYAQTLVYGLFAARYHASDTELFTREAAAKLIPQSNPFLRKLFQRLGVYDLDVRVAWIIDDLVGVFGATDVRSLLDANKAERDPVMLFYEDFLTAYNPERRKARGVYYTPAPVVSFIVRAVDDLLQKEFELKDGLADYSQALDGTHRLQILDPATGTGTFLVEVVRKIYSKFEGQQGVWNDYVRDHLLPRLHGYEILMAPYAMAHLNLEYVFRETGATTLGESRYGIYLTNTLEDSHFDGNLFSPIDQEAQAVSQLKQGMRVMVMLGNPPYNVSSSNKSQWIEDLMLTYKADLNEKNIKPLSDDYIKFIRYAQWQIERTGDGIIGFITNNSFLDGVIHRTMRWELLRVFDEIYVVNLHGNSRLKEKTPEGWKDENVFDIQAGVSITILVKHKESKPATARVHYAELYGSRKEKFAALQALCLKRGEWQLLKPVKPYYFFVPKTFVTLATDESFSLRSLFWNSGLAPLTKRDKAVVQFSRNGVTELLDNAEKLDANAFRAYYALGQDTDWRVDSAISDVQEHRATLAIIDYVYRPFDVRKVPYTGQKGLFARPCFSVLGALLHSKNYALCTTRQVRDNSFRHCLITSFLPDKACISDGTYAFPLYKFPADWDYTPAEIVAGITKDGKKIELELNMRPEILAKISEAIGEPVKGEEVFDYIYGVLNDREYRTKYFEFLKIEYPRIPYPKDLAEYQRFVQKGEYLRHLHLMDETLDLPPVATFDVAGSNEITVERYEDGADAISGRVWINDTQYFDHVPRAVWDHYVGAYQPARLWLQKRIGRRLDYDDVRWYLRICATIAAELKFRGE